MWMQEVVFGEQKRIEATWYGVKKKKEKYPRDGNSNLTNERIKLANNSLIFPPL